MGANQSTCAQAGGANRRRMNGGMNKEMKDAMNHLEKAAKNYEKAVKNANKNMKNMSETNKMLMEARAKNAMSEAEFQMKYAEMCMKGECPDMPMSCPEGEIMRDGYVAHKKNGDVMVMPSCIENRGKPGKQGPQILLPDDEDLAKFGYKRVKKMSKKKRQEALDKCVEEYGAKEVIRRLQALVNLRAGGTDKKGKKIFEQDLEYVYTHHPANYKTKEAKEKQEKAMKNAANKKNKNADAKKNKNGDGNAKKSKNGNTKKSKN
jgi:hypothetical protein